MSSKKTPAMVRHAGYPFTQCMLMVSEHCTNPFSKTAPGYAPPPLPLPPSLELCFLVRSSRRLVPDHCPAQTPFAHCAVGFMTAGSTARQGAGQGISSGMESLFPYCGTTPPNLAGKAISGTRREQVFNACGTGIGRNVVFKLRHNWTF